ncbi:MAG TPA: polysaccharide biosynthesis/export family protein [Vicinamibacterales bacterium]|nr:polysaccharide biosynthesis/export family protein [Vicinamibacterales bacterium]
MCKNPLFIAIAFTVTTGAAFAAPRQTPQPPPPSAPQAPAPGTIYRTDFEIPKVEGSGGQTRTETASTEGYVIGPQDNLSIIVSDETELTGKYRVDTDGTISMPYLSRVPLAGLSLAEAQDKITALLKAGFIRNPQVRIEVDQFKARNVLVTGEVRTPGKVTLPGTTMSLLEALALAGSPTQNASNDVLVMHPPKPGEKAPEPITVNRKDLELGKVGRDLVLQDGDIVNVPVAKRFYISGFIKNPGSFVLDTGTTVAQAIILAGGLNERGSDRRITIIRSEGGKSVEISAKLEDRVQPNDEVKVKSRFF